MFFRIFFIWANLVYYKEISHEVISIQTLCLHVMPLGVEKNLGELFLFIVFNKASLCGSPWIMCLHGSLWTMPRAPESGNLGAKTWRRVLYALWWVLQGSWSRGLSSWRVENVLEVILHYQIRLSYSLKDRFLLFAIFLVCLRSPAWF